jgi:hypothetical protein
MTPCNVALGMWFTRYSAVVLEMNRHYTAALDFILVTVFQALISE